MTRADADPLADLTAIVRERYDTGAYGDCHLKVGTAVYGLMRAIPLAKSAPLVGGGLGPLLAIPIVVDDSLPAGSWRLVRYEYGEAPDFARTETVVRQGTVTL